MRHLNKNISVRLRMVVLAIAFTTSLYSQVASIRINEFMAVNQSGLIDDDGDYSDWIELYNASGDAVNLQGWSLTDDALVLAKWVFPDVTLESGDYLLVYASSKGRSVSSAPLHTNFKLSGSGEYLALINSSGSVVSQFTPSFPEQHADVSYGYYEDGYITFSDPTPGEDNSLSTTLQLPTPLMSHSHGFYEESFSLTMTSDVPAASIYYTLDGSVPTKGSGTLYSEPLVIGKTTVLRAVSILDGVNQSKINTNSYLFTSDIITQNNTPQGYPNMWGPYATISGNAIADYEMDSELIGDAAFAAKVKEALQDLPTISLVTDKNHFFNGVDDAETGGIYMYTGPPTGGSGDGWERPTSFEYIDPKEDLAFQIDCGVRLHGGHSRLPEKSPKHSLRLAFRSEYGVTKLKNAFFGEDAASEFNTLVLRAGFCNSWLHHSATERDRAQFTRDSWAKDTQKQMGHLASNNRFAHLYINGIYWGLYNPTERIDDDFCATYLEGNKEDFDIIKDYTEVASGTITAWNSMMSIARSGMTSNDNYQLIQGKNPDGSDNSNFENYLDVVSLIDYMLINMYGGNTDWDHHNWAAVRNRVKPGKGFQFVCWDSEHVLKTLGENVVGENNSNCPSELFQLLKQNEEFKRLVADRAQKHCLNNGLLSPSGSVATWLNRVSEIDKSVDAEAARWGDYRRDVHPYQTGATYELYTREDFLEQQGFMLNTYFPGRTSAFITQLENADLFPTVEAPSFFVNESAFNGGVVSENDVLTMSASAGSIYYTIDGSDPADWSDGNEASELIIVASNKDKEVIIPTADLGEDWYTKVSFSSDGWLSCTGDAGGVGYEKSSGYEDFLSLDVNSQMYNGNTSCLIRIPFNISKDISQYNTMSLLMMYDDGFVAYLNGVKIAEVNAPSALSWNAAASASHEASAFESFDVTSYISNLVEGDNLLAIQGLNKSATSSDFIISSELKLVSQSLESGGLSSSAISYSGPIVVDKSTRIRARTFLNNEWSAINDKYLTILSDYDDLKITEIHYNPLADDLGESGKYEFIELKNIGNGILDLSGITFVDGIEYQFPQETDILPGNFIVLAASDDAFFARYGFWPFDDYKGQLDNNGEWLKITALEDDTICKVKYNDGALWPQTPDGAGNSLVPTFISPVGDPNDPTNWRASYNVGGSPGEDDLMSSAVEKINSFNGLEVKLSQNYPNPFKAVTYIDYQLTNDAFVELQVYDLMGVLVRSVVSQFEESGLHQVRFEDANLSSGVYFYRLTVKGESNTQVLTKKMLTME